FGRNVFECLADVLVRDPLRRIVRGGMRRDPITPARLFYELAMARIENRDAVVRAAFKDESIQLAHDARFVCVAQCAYFVAELFAIKLGDVLHILEGRIELRYPVLI